MSKSANVLSVDTLKDFKIQMCNFAEDARNALADICDRVGGVMLTRPARSRPDLRRPLPASREGYEHHRTGHRPTQSVTESPRRAAHWLDPPRVPESCSRARRATPPPHPYLLLRLLPSSAHPPRARQGRPRLQADRAIRGGPDRAASGGRRPAPSLRSPSGVVHILGPLYHRARTLPVRRYLPALAPLSRIR